MKPALRFLILLLLLLSFPNVRSERSYWINDEHIQRFRLLQTALEKNDPTGIAEFFSLPYRLPYPVPSIQTAEEFAERIDEVLDEKVRTRLMNADPENDLALMGWRGIMLHHGLAWFHEHNFRIFAVNHPTETVLKKRAGLIVRMKENLHPSAREFHLPVLEQETHSYRFRIDQLEDESYQLVMWPWKKSFLEEPQMILTSGKIDFAGSGYNHTYTFKNNNDVYEVDIYIIGTRTTPPGEIVVYQAGEEIFRQPFPLEFRALGHRVWIEYTPDNKARLHLWNAMQKPDELPDVLIEDGEIIYTDEPDGNLYVFQDGGRRYEVWNPFKYHDKHPPKRLKIFDGDQLITEEELKPRSVFR